MLVVQKDPQTPDIYTLVEIVSSKLADNGLAQVFSKFLELFYAKTIFHTQFSAQQPWTIHFPAHPSPSPVHSSTSAIANLAVR